MSELIRCCENCWYYSNGHCDARHGQTVNPNDDACSEYAARDE